MAKLKTESPSRAGQTVDVVFEKQWLGATTEPDQAAAVEWSTETGSERTDETHGSLIYIHRMGLEAFLQSLRDAPPLQVLATERAGISAAFVADLARRMDIPYIRLAAAIGIPKATAARKASGHGLINGAAVMGLVQLVLLAQDLVADSLNSTQEGFDTLAWFGQWLERPQPALGGRQPLAFLDTPTGITLVARVLGAIRSGAYQ